MRVLSVNVGRPREVEWHGRQVLTSIWKSPVAGPVRVTTLNLDGDAQSDLSVHGGPEKAVYGYPAEHYDDWRRELSLEILPWGSFGENLTTSGLREQDLAIGDCIRIGSVELMVTQPRMPCFKLGIRFGRGDMVKRFLRSGRSGFYFAVVQEGSLTAGDPLQFTTREPHRVTVADLAALDTGAPRSPDVIRRALQVPALAESWKRHLRKISEE
jgi:MOSC domain-containing protein YiiM